MDHKQLSSLARVAAGIMLLLALGSWQYGYYQILRVVVTACAAYLAWYMFDKKQSGWGAAFVIAAILFNPIYPIYLQKDTWQLIDVGAAILFFASFSAKAED